MRRRTSHLGYEGDQTLLPSRLLLVDNVSRELLPNLMRTAAFTRKVLLEQCTTVDVVHCCGLASATSLLASIHATGVSRRCYHSHVRWGKLLVWWTQPVAFVPPIHKDDILLRWHMPAVGNAVVLTTNILRNCAVGLFGLQPEHVQHFHVFFMQIGDDNDPPVWLLHQPALGATSHFLARVNVGMLQSVSQPLVILLLNEVVDVTKLAARSAEGATVWHFGESHCLKQLELLRERH
mmetsp:Transcript_17669/g.40944  ORF Transcript_17669/g.40944 Transcript_17669/m.40944 type:complete len:236 (-) Transcript_17669:1640-2347(-)